MGSGFTVSQVTCGDDVHLTICCVTPFGEWVASDRTLVGEVRALGERLLAQASRRVWNESAVVGIAMPLWWRDKVLHPVHVDGLVDLGLTVALYSPTTAGGVESPESADFVLCWIHEGAGPVIDQCAVSVSRDDLAELGRYFATIGQEDSVLVVGAMGSEAFPVTVPVVRLDDSGAHRLTDGVVEPVKGLRLSDLSSLSRWVEDVVGAEAAGNAGGEVYVWQAEAGGLRLLVTRAQENDFYPDEKMFRTTVVVGDDMASATLACFETSARILLQDVQGSLDTGLTFRALSSVVRTTRTE